MRAWTVTSYGEPGEVLRLDEDAESPTAGPGQVKIRVEAAGLGLPDVLSCRKAYPMTPPLPFIPSQEVAGEVIAVGPGVDESLVGKRVCGGTDFVHQHGGLADECLMSAAGAHPVADGMSAAEAAGFMIPYHTAWVGLIRRPKLVAGETVLILGAAGSSGCAAVQLAKAVGARVIAVAGGPDKVAFCRSIGADEVIDYRSEDIKTRARELTDGKGVQVVFDAVGGKPGLEAFKATAFEGRFVYIGFAAGDWTRIEVGQAVFRNISLMGAMPTFPAEVARAAHLELLDHWRSGALKVVGNQVFSFADGNKAIEHIAAGKVEGKVVVRIRD